MLITNTYQNTIPQNSKQNTTKVFINNTPVQDKVSFKGHLGIEKYVKDGKELKLIKETRFFRDIQTKNFVKEYISKNFTDKSNLKLVVGGCSTGEEVYTYSMLLNNLKAKLSIIGFDISHDSIKQAKSGKFVMQRPADKLSKKCFGHTDFHKDSYLCFDTDNKLSEEELSYKKLFDSFFEPTNEEPKQTKESIYSKLKKWYSKNIFKISQPNIESKNVKLKDGKAENCQFTTGDIMDLDKVTKGEKADIITFTNAMYHLTTNDIANGMLRVPKDNSEEIVRKIATNVKENLNPNGIFVLGEDEVLQQMNATTIPKVFKEMGFQALNETEHHEANVYKLLC